VLNEMRSLVQAQVADEAARRELLERWCEPRWMERLRRDGRDAVVQSLREELRVAAEPR